MMELEKCPACGSKARYVPVNENGTFIECSHISCKVQGPNEDPTGKKWNAMCRGIAARSQSGVPCTPDNTKVGAVVRLNSGGREMTVTEYSADGRPGLLVVTDHFIDSVYLDLACLTLVRPAPEQKGGE